ncbi:MAG: phosphoenolpyruvate--protein phosphotransferase [Candidatus Kapaibacterium sp.]
MTEPSSSIPPAERVFDGIPASAGITIAHAFILSQDEDPSPHDPRLEAEEIQIELERFTAALAEADKVLEQIEMMARADVRDRAEIFEALRMMLCDPSLTIAIEEQIRESRSTARAAIVLETNRLAAIFSNSGDETIRSRAEDMRSLQTHLIACLQKAPVDHRFHDSAVLILSTLSPSDTVLYARNQAGAFVLESGGINSHAAILARAFGVPMVAGLKGIARMSRPQGLVIVDGYAGRVIIDPEPETIRQYSDRKAVLEEQRSKLGSLRDLPAETSDGTRIALAANLDMIDEVDAALENGAEEIGLMRTEYLVMGRSGDVSMDEQYSYYRQLAERAYPLPVTLRAFDIGSEKLAGEIWGRNSSPLGMRGTRLLLARREVLDRQIEAVLRASSMKNLKLMFPMVSSVEEIRRLKEVIADVGGKLRAKNVRFDEHMLIGAMLETPAAALTADAFAAECDFLSLGTNDLAQYTLAVDRTDDALASYYDEFHPGILRLIRACSVAARRAGIPLTVCGELAANPLATGVLIGLGIRRLSVQPIALGALKMRIRAIDTDTAGRMARDVIRLKTAAEVRGYLMDCA